MHGWHLGSNILQIMTVVNKSLAYLSMLLIAIPVGGLNIIYHGSFTSGYITVYPDICNICWPQSIRFFHWFIWQVKGPCQPHGREDVGQLPKNSFLKYWLANLTSINNLYFPISCPIILNYRKLFPRNKIAYFTAYFYELCGSHLVAVTLLWHHNGYYTYYQGAC